MKILHSLVNTPHLSGLWQTSHELIEAEKRLGVEVEIVDPSTDEPRIFDADVIVDHSGLSRPMMASKIPVVHVHHGRPRSSFLVEARGGPKAYSNMRTISRDRQYRAFVTFWPEHVRYLQLYFDNVVHVIDAPVDLDSWTPDGPKGYKFHGKKGSVNIVCTDVFRDDIDPFHVIHGFLVAAKDDWKLHMFGFHKMSSSLQTLLQVLSDRGQLGEVAGWIRGLEHVYRASDLLVTAHRIATRSVREASACGLQVLMGGKNRFGFPYADHETVDDYADAMRHNVEMTANPREIAEKYFDSNSSARQLLEIIEGVI